VLRNLNPRYEASRGIVQGTVLRAPKRVAALYHAQLHPGPARGAGGGTGPRQPRLDAGGDRHGPAAAPLRRPLRRRWRRATRASAVDAEEKEEAFAGHLRVRSGDSLIAIAKDHSCEGVRAGEGEQDQGARPIDQAGPAPQARRLRRAQGLARLSVWAAHFQASPSFTHVDESKTSSVRDCPSLPCSAGPRSWLRPRPGSGTARRSR
jgi:hypothetical protein